MVNARLGDPATFHIQEQWIRKWLLRSHDLVSIVNFVKVQSHIEI